MGLLDDAIREHLDLKRRRGADPAEIERAEREALGPVRRNRDAAAVEELEPEPTVGVVEDELEREGEYPPAPDDEFDGEPLTSYADDDPDGGVATDLAEIGADPGGAFDDAHPTGELRRDDGPEAESAAPPLTSPREDGPIAPMGDATAEFDVPAALAAEDARAPAPTPPAAEVADDDEDVLEETPEFLSDTPDHDRLWFEQRPPRDFDFDG